MSRATDLFTIAYANELEPVSVEAGTAQAIDMMKGLIPGL